VSDSERSPILHPGDGKRIQELLDGVPAVKASKEFYAGLAKQLGDNFLGVPRKKLIEESFISGVAWCCEERQKADREIESD